MANWNYSVADRFKSLQPTPPEGNFTIAGVRMMYEGAGGEEFHCTISEFCRTQVFKFPRVTFHPKGKVPHMPLYSSASIQAHVTSDLVDYFKNSTPSKHYDIDPGLRHVVAETDVKVRAQQKDTPVFIVVKEVEQLTSVAMTKGECSMIDETVVRNGETVPMLVGGRDGEKFLMAWHTLDGAWPELPNNQLSVNLILAAVRAGQETPDPIRRHVDVNCLVTDDGRCVQMIRPRVSGRASTSKDMDAAELEGQVSEIAGAITAMEQDIGTPHLALLVNSMYSDEHKDDPYKRLHYLQLWQAMADAARKTLGFNGKIRKSKKVVSGKHRLNELKDYRDDIAHWRTDSIDENYLTDLQRTINELMRQKYF